MCAFSGLKREMGDDLIAQIRAIKERETEFQAQGIRKSEIKHEVGKSGLSSECSFCFRVCFFRLGIVEFRIAVGSWSFYSSASGLLCVFWNFGSL
jgi:hypothetical protein